MPRETRFSRRAAERLADIAGWAESTFGPAQADPLSGAAARPAGRACREPRADPCPLLRPTGEARHDELMMLKVGRHLLILRPEERRWVVIDIVQDAQGLSAWISDQEDR